MSMLAGCGGGSSSSTTQTTPPPSNPTPAITTIAPGSLVAGSSSQTITLTGSGFISATVVDLNNTALTTTYVNATSVQAAVPASALAADGTVKITATNPAPGGGTSAVHNYSITVPVPVISALSPQTIAQNAATTITITGTGFEANSVAQWNGAARTTTFVNATTLTVALTAADAQNFGVGQITVVNPGLGPTTPLDLVIMASVPTITGVNPNSVSASTGTNVPQTVFISGSGFASSATVQANGQPVPVVAQSSTSITVTLAASYFAQPGSISLVVSNPGTPVVSSNPGVITVTGAGAPSFTVSPSAAPAGSPDTLITLNGTGFYQDSVVQWNNSPLKTTYVNSTQVTATIPAALLAGFVQANIGVSSSENTTQPAPQPFDTFLSLPINDIVYNGVDGFIYASIPGSAGENLGNTIAQIDPTTGVIEKTIFVGSEPNRLALSTDGTQLFVGLNGAGAVRQVDLTKATAGVQFSLGGGPGVYNPPYTAVGLAAVPGQPNSVAVYATNGVVTIFDSGVARTNTSTGLQTYFVDNVGGLAFGGSASTLYVMSNAIGGYLYRLTVDATGVTAATQLGTGTGGSTMQYDNGRIYIPTGVVLSATTGAQVGQFSTTSGSTSNPTPAAGPVYSDSSLNRAWVVSGGTLLSFDETTFNPVASVPVTGMGINSGQNFPAGAADLVRWGSNGVAFHTPTQLYVFQGAIVKDESASPADVSVTVQAPATATTGSSLTYTMTVSNLGPNAAQGVTLDFILPASVSAGTVQASQGSCSGPGEYFCDLGTIASGGSVTVTAAVTPTTAATVQVTGRVSSVSYDPISTNNQSTASTTTTGPDIIPVPVVTQLSPNLIQAGTSTFTLTVDGSGFSSASVVDWNGQALPTTTLSSGQLTATVDASLIKNLGYSLVSVSTPAPGGGQSGVLPFSIYSLLNVPANAMAFDPFTRKLYAVLPSTSPSLTGNSIVAVDPTTGSIGTPVNVGSEPNVLSETSDGNYFFVGLSGAKSLGRFNLLTQKLDLTVPLPTSGVSSTNGPAMAIAAIPGSDSSLAVEIDSFDGIGILDISGSTGTFRSKFGFGYSGDYPVFVDATHFYAYDAATTGAEFYRYSVDANGAELIDGTSLNGMGGFGGRLAADGGLVYGSGGGIINPSTTPPSQVAVLPLGTGLYGSSLIGGGVVPYEVESKSFNIGVNAAGTAISFLERFDTQHFTLEDELQFPTSSVSSMQGTRWGQDGLAYLIPTTGSSNSSTQIFVIRGPFVVPAETNNNPAPSLSSTDHNTIAAGGGNLIVTVTGSGFLPGATILWNNSPRTTTYVDSSHVSVAIPAADIQAAGTITLGSENPGSGASNTITIKVQ